MLKPTFFTFYTPRSGSTFLIKKICERFQVYTPPESNFIPNLFKIVDSESSVVSLDQFAGILDTLKKEPKFHDLQIDENNLQDEVTQNLPLDRNSLVSIFLSKAFEAKSDNLDFGVKKGSYLFSSDEIRTVFPDASFILLIRDPRAVFNSQKNNIRSSTGKPFETNPISFSRNFHRTMSVLRKSHNSESTTTLLLNYEALISQTDEIVDKIGELFGLKARDDTENNAYTVPSRFDYGLHENVNKGSIKANIDKWQNELSFLEKTIIKILCLPHIKWMKKGPSFELNKAIKNTEG